MKICTLNRILLCLSLSFLGFACEENSPGRKLQLLEVTPVECDARKDLILDYQYLPENDTVSYVINGNLLTLTIGFNGNCCSTFLPSSGFVRDTIEIEIIEAVPGSCNCICYFTSILVYTGLDKNYFYTVVLPDDKIFRGKIEFE